MQIPYWSTRRVREMAYLKRRALGIDRLHQLAAGDPWEEDLPPSVRRPESGDERERRLDRETLVKTALLQLDSADRAARNLSTATWALVCATVVLAAATIVLAVR